jgi:diguanylate cyclase
VLKLWRQLAAAPGRASDHQLDELASVLFPKAGTSGADKPTGLLGRLLQRDVGSPPNEMLRELINSLEWPGALQHQVIDLQVRLKADALDDAWVDVVREISGLAVTAFDQVSQDAEAASAFLAQLSERLRAIDQFMLGEGERRSAARQSGARLGRAVSDEVGDLSANIQSQGDLSSLRSQVLGTLDKIQHHVAVHLQEENERIDLAEQQAEQLREKLAALEQETFDLRRQVADSHHKAMTDPLTGLPNRRAYEDRAEQELARWKRFGEPLALVVWDVDNFKQINDVFGHKAGDRALAVIARILREGMRETDFIARYGGEEFVVLLPGADQGDAMKVANLMRKRVANAGMHSHNKPVTITLSGGVAMAQAEEGIERLFERADTAMYQAKQSGKDRVIAA